MANKCGRRTRTSRSAWFITVLLLINVSNIRIMSVAGEGGHIAQEMEEKSPIAKMLMDTLVTLKKSHKSSWDKIKAVVHDFQLQFFPPNLDFRGQEQEVNKGKGGAGGRMKDAAGKSFEASKITAEESAKSAAKVVGEAVYKVKDKLADDDEEPHQHVEF